jgi:hypothetical protein
VCFYPIENNYFHLVQCLSQSLLRAYLIKKTHLQHLITMFHPKYGLQRVLIAMDGNVLMHLHIGAISYSIC